MNTTTLRDRREFSALLGLAALLLAGGIYATRAYLMDDTLITLRYSLNLARHGHAIWNQADASQPSLGYTTLLWMLFNAIPAFFTDNKDALILACKLLGLVPLSVLALLMVEPISRMPIPRPFRVAIVLVIFSQALYGFHLNSGMETLLFSCLILLSVWTYLQDDRSALAYVFGILAFLTRPEGAIGVALLLVWDLRRGRTRQAAVGGLGFALAALALGVVLHAAYGAVLPNAFYVKQGYFSLGSLKQTLKFLAFLAFPYLPLAAYSVYGLKNTASRYCWQAAVVYSAYYLTVTPVMNIFERYQWPVLVLLTYASLPAFQKLGEGITAPGRVRRRQLAGAALLLFALVNLRSALAASYLAATTGIIEGNLITLGKAMAKDREDSRWLAYHDAGAVCYYSDWNAYDTKGLNTRPIAVGSIKPMRVYGYPHTDLVLLNCDETDGKSRRGCGELRARLGQMGYHYAGQVPILSEGNQRRNRRRWVVVLLARSLPRARALLQNVQVGSEMPASPLDRVYALAGGIVRSRLTWGGPGEGVSG